jgi:hypothetical protein
VAISTQALKWKRDRKPGDRAGLNREIIVAEAARQFAVIGADEFSLRLVARRFYVFPAAIRSFFKGGVSELRCAIASAVLAELVTATFHPSKKDAESYLIQVMRSALSRFGQKPHLGRLAITELTNDPLVSPAFAERICSAVVLLAPKRDPISGLELFVGRLAALAMVECGAWGREYAKGINVPSPKNSEKPVLKNEPDSSTHSAKPIKTTTGTQTYVSGRLALLDPKKFPTLATTPNLGISLKKRAGAGYLDKAAAEAAKALIAELTRGPKKEFVA